MIASQGRGQLAEMMCADMMRNATIALLGAWLALCAQTSSAAGLYKWTDERGVVHYSDQIPPEAADKGTVVLDKQGRQVKKIEPAPTQAQLKAKEAEDERQKAMARTREDRARKDLALLQSYTSAEEIDFARARALAAVDTQLKSAEAYNAELVRRLGELERQKTAPAGKAGPATLDNQISALNEEMGRQAKLIAQKKDEMAAISAKYDADKRHWIEIKADQERAAAAENAAAGASSKPSAAKAATGSAATTTR